MAKKDDEIKEVIPKKVKPGIYTEDTYTFTLPLSSEKQDDLTVCINGNITKIQRGVPVTVSAAIYEVIKNSENMDTQAVQRRNKLAQQFSK